jgi:heme/copper-type cytochrome/quinol oxidase subunit 2
MNCIFSKSIVCFLLNLNLETLNFKIMNQQTSNSKEQQDLIKKRKTLYTVLGVLLFVLIVYFYYTFFIDNWSENTSHGLSGLFIILNSTFLIVFLIVMINASIKKLD